MAETFRGAVINVARKFAQRATQALRSQTGAPVAEKREGRTGGVAEMTRGGPTKVFNALN